jgi:16S rRNA (adenine1518-N6/adenine1519-N6)-dimethyltransferase
LTRELAAVARRVIAIEVDRDLIPELRERMPSNVEIVEGDALAVDFAALAAGRFHAAGNLPYNIATPLLKRFIECRSRIEGVTIMLQKEVAVRIMAMPGSAEYGPLSVLIQYYAKPSYGFTVPAGAFHPRPRVDSAVIRLEWKPGVRDDAGFTGFVQRCFSTRRKKLVNNLLRNDASLTREHVLERLQSAAISPRARPEELSIEDFWRVYNQIRKS